MSLVRALAALNAFILSEKTRYKLLLNPKPKEEAFSNKTERMSAGDKQPEKASVY